MEAYELIYSEAFRKFRDGIMDRHELLVFELFFERLKGEPGGEGRKEFAHHGPRRILHFSYYVSPQLRTVFVLMGYQERRGEPRAGDLKNEQELLEAIYHREA